MSRITLNATSELTYLCEELLIYLLRLCYAEHEEREGGDYPTGGDHVSRAVRVEEGAGDSAN
jgi:hypothetical protein